ncbi:MAG: c-type cytochrome [Deltaproteobacteria bacterium]|nr:c-type cytochrome [Deltaproteobacteria bacterium]
MKRLLVVLFVAVGLAATVVAASFWALVLHGFDARRRPSAVEAFFARHVRRLAIPAADRRAPNPVERTVDVLREASQHFADHCASCHGNDGAGDTDIGGGLYPPPPDMRREATQSLSDGELFYVIHNGVPFTGMPAWGQGDAARDLDSWTLVHFIRHLPEISAEEIAEMERRNPKSAEERQEEDEERRFLEGDDAAGAPAAGRHRH